MPPPKKIFKRVDGVWSVSDASDSDDEWNTDDETAVPIAVEGGRGRYVRFAQKNGLAYGEGVADNVSTMSRWIRVQTRRLDALTRRMMSDAVPRARSARAVGNAVTSAAGVAGGSGAIACPDDNDDAGDDDDDAAAVAVANTDVSDVIEISDEDVDDGVVSMADVPTDSLAIRGVSGDNPDVVNGDVVEIINDEELDTVDNADAGFVVVVDQPRVAAMSPNIDPVRVEGACSINQLGGGSEDRGIEQNAGNEPEDGSAFP